MPSIKTFAKKSIGNYYYVPFANTVVWEGNRNRTSTADHSSLADAIRETCFDQNKTFTPTIAFDAMQGFLMTDDNTGETIAVIVEGFRRHAALSQLQAEGYIIETVPFNYISNIDPNTAEGKAQFYALQIAEDQRKSPLEVARILNRMQVECGMTAVASGKVAGISESTVSQYNSVLQYPELHHFIENGDIKLKTAFNMISRSKGKNPIPLNEQIEDLKALLREIEQEKQTQIQAQAAPSTEDLEVDDQEDQDSERSPSRLAGTPKKAPINGKSENGGKKRSTKGTGKGTDARVSDSRFKKRLDQKYGQDIINDAKKFLDDKPVIDHQKAADLFAQKRQAKITSLVEEIYETRSVLEDECNDLYFTPQYSTKIEKELEYWVNAEYEHKDQLTNQDSTDELNEDSVNTVDESTEM